MAKQKRIDLRVTEQEKAAWQRRAAEAGISLSEMIRRSLQGQRAA